MSVRKSFKLHTGGVPLFCCWYDWSPSKTVALIEGGLKAYPRIALSINSMNVYQPLRLWTDPIRVLTDVRRSMVAGGSFDTIIDYKRSEIDLSLSCISEIDLNWSEVCIRASGGPHQSHRNRWRTILAKPY